MVQYMSGQDLNLEMHVDDAEVTLNVCLTDQFSGSGLSFCGCVGEKQFFKHAFTYKHKKGRAVLHPGKQRHGADDITAGERYNLIVWCRSTEYRISKEFHMLSRHEMEDPPDLICLSSAEKKRVLAGKKNFLYDE